MTLVLGTWSRKDPRSLKPHRAGLANQNPECSEIDVLSASYFYFVGSFWSLLENNFFPDEGLSMATASSSRPICSIRLAGNERSPYHQGGFVAVINRKPSHKQISIKGTFMSHNGKSQRSGRLL